MTTTVVYAGSGDGYIQSSNASYATAQAGSSLSAQLTATGMFGQSYSGGVHTQYQTFLRFAWSAVPAADTVTSAAVQVKLAAVSGPSVVRNMEIRGFFWDTGGLTTADWRTASQLSTAGEFAIINTINGASVGARTRAGSEALRNYVKAQGSASFVVATSRQVNGTVPTGTETAAIHLSGASGTTSDPALVFTTVPASRLFGVLGASVQLSDQTWVYLENTGSGVDIKHVSATGTVTTVTALPIGTGSTDFAAPTGSQGLALVADPATNLWVLGRVGNAPNSVMIRRYARYQGVTWLGGAASVAALASHSAPVNQVVATYVDTSPPSILALAAHTTGDMVPAGSPDVVWLAFTTGVNTTLLGTGNATGLAEQTPPSGDYGGHRNEVGSGLDLVASADNPGWTYTGSFKRGQVPGDNGMLGLARFIYDNAVVLASNQATTVYGTKDASAKVRAVEASGGMAVLVTADRDSGWGISASIRQHAGVATGSTTLAEISLAGESIASMPDGPAVGAAQTWDAAYSELENALWVYYVDATNPLRVRRTSINLDSYAANRNEVTVYTAPAGATIQAVRVPRSARIINRTLLQVAYSVSGVNSLANVVDVYNLAPSAPILAARSGVDASLAFSLSWTFGDLNPGDTQSAYQVQIEDTANPGVAVVDTGKVASTAQTRTVTAGTLTNGKLYQWRVRTWDQLDLAGPYSAYGQFPAAAGGAVTITAPAIDNQPDITTDEYQVAWTTAGTVQAGYRVWLYRGATLVSDSGWLTSTAQTHLVTGMTSDVQHEIRVQVRNAALVTSSIASRLVTPSFGTPETPVPTIDAVPDGGYIQVQVFNPAPGQVPGSSIEHQFEVGDATPYTVEGGTFSAGDTTRAYVGSASGKGVAAGGTALRVYPTSRFPIAAGNRYTCRFMVWSAAGRTVWAGMDWVNADGAKFGGVTQSVVVPPSAWTLVSSTASAPDGTVAVEYGMRLLGSPTPTAGEAIWLDDLLLLPASDRPDAVLNEIYRRVAGGDDLWELIGTCPPDGVYRDYAASAGVPYEYKVRAVS